MGVLLDESELPTPDFVQFYHRFEYTAFGISVVVVLSTMAVIVFSKTKGISKYRWYLIHTLLWSFFFDAMGTFIGAVTLFPVPCYYGVNAAGNTDKVTQTVYFFVGVAAVIGKICSLLFQFEHRYYQTQSAHSSYRYMCSRVQGFLEILVRFFLTVVFMIIVMVPFALFFPDQEEEKALLISMDPVIAKIFDQHPGTLCFSSGTDVSTVLLPPTIIVAIIPFVCCLTLYIIYTSIRTQFSANTQRLQMMLFWSLVAQMGAFFVLLIVPLLFFIGASLLGIRNLPIYSMYCFFPVLCHTSVDCFMILYFIRPYRRFLIKHMMFLRTTSRQSGGSVSHTNVNTRKVLPKLQSALKL